MPVVSADSARNIVSRPRAVQECASRVLSEGRASCTMPHQCKRFEGKVAIISAATAGIGLGIAHRIGQEGARLCICSRRQVQYLSSISATFEFLNLINDQITVLASKNGYLLRRALPVVLSCCARAWLGRLHRFALPTLRVLVARITWTAH